MALLIYRLTVCLVIATFWGGAYNVYKNMERTKGAKIFLAVYS